MSELFGEKKQKMEKPYVSAVIAAAGSATRMGGLDKQFEEIGGAPVLVWSMMAFMQSDWIDEIVVVTRTENIPLVLDLIHAYGLGKIRSVLAGGDTRQASVQKGISAISGQAAYVAIHDGARPMVSSQTIADAVLNAIYYGAAAAAVPVTDTIKVADEKRMVVSTPERGSLYAMQTPQVFSLPLYREAAEAALAAGRDFTDDCQMLEYFGKPVYLSKGEYANLKITTPLDLLTARALFEERGGAG